MLTDEKRAALEAAWAPARAAGALGRTCFEDLWSHSSQYAELLCAGLGVECSTWNGRIIDVGSGAGVPGVMLAAQLGKASVTLVDASERRAGYARGAVQALELAHRCVVVHGRGDELAHTAAHRAGYDVAVARLLGDAAEALEQLAALVRPGGLVLVSVATSEVGRWRAADLGMLGGARVTVEERAAGSRALVRVPGPVPARFPRRVAARRRAPLF